MATHIYVEKFRMAVLIMGRDNMHFIRTFSKILSRVTQHSKHKQHH